MAAPYSEVRLIWSSDAARMPVDWNEPVHDPLRPLMQHSVVRRSLIVTAAFVIGHLFHYGLMFSANRILDPGAFGRFYAALSLLNVLLTPATVLSFMFAKHFSVVFSAAGAASLVAELDMLMRRHGAAGLVLVMLSALALMLVGSLLGADALLLLMLVPSVALLVYLFEMARAALQGMLDFYSYGAAWIGWRIGQYVLAVLALLITGAAWAGMAAIFFATAIATLVLLQVMRRRAKAAPGGVAGAAWPPLRIMAAAPFALQYGIFILISNVDILVAYLVLSNDQLGSYAASSLLPKAIVTATLPVSQVMLPVMSADEGARMWTALLKAVGVSAFLSTVGVAVLALGSELACNDQFGIRFCSPWLLEVLALGAIPLSVSRVLVVAGLALGTVRQIAAPATVIIGFGAIVFIWATSPSTLAVIYTGFCWLFVLVYGLATFYGRRNMPGAVSPAPVEANAPDAP